MNDSRQSNLAFDSERQYIGTVYAKALLGAAEKSNQTTEVLAEFDDAVAALDRLPQLEATLASPRVPLEAKQSMIDKAFGSGNTVLVNFFKVVCQHGRFDSLRVIHRTAQTMHDETIGRVEVTVTTATEVSPTLQQSIASHLERVLGKQVRIQSKVDDKILGGLVVRVGDTVYDGSLVNQLEKVRSSAVEHAVQAIRQSLDRFVVEA